MWRISDIVNLSFTTYHLAPLGLDAALSMKQRKRESKIGPNIFPMPWSCSSVSETQWKLDSIIPINILFHSCGKEQERQEKEKLDIFFLLY